MVDPGSCYSGAAAGMAALQLFYNVSTGLWDTTDWWQGANALGATIDYTAITNTLTYRNNIFNTYEKPKYPGFLNPWFYDDDGWWALTWIKAYDLTGDTRYLDLAKNIFQEMTRGWDDTCGGGLWWKKQERQYKNAITSELFMAVAARLHLRTPGDRGAGSYLDWAQRTWNWFQQTGMINGQSLVNDGLDRNCKNNGQTTWTYNQGVILGALVDLYKSTQDTSFLVQAEAIANAAIRTLAPNGILREPCEPDCGNDGPQFKGIFIRNLSYLYQTRQNPIYKEFITRNADSIWTQNRNVANQFGLRWAGPFDSADAMRQSSALDALNASLQLNIQGTYQAENSILRGLTTATANREFRGTGYVTNWNREAQSVSFNLATACAGWYDLRFRYLTPAGDASRYLYVNGKVIARNQRFPARDRWSDITIPNIWLNAGSNTISLIFNQSQGSHNRLNLDEMSFAPTNLQP